MTIRGHIKGGVIVLDEAAHLPEGAVVEVRVVEAHSKKDNREALKRFVGIFDDLPPDASSNIDRVVYGIPPE